MKTTLRLEELAQFLACVYLFSFTTFDWWWFPAFLLAPDIGMLGYTVNNRVGAFCYNLFHHKDVALLFLLGGVYQWQQWMILIGLILYAHASFDRILGYGLKYEQGFKYTHLGNL